jgi:hypothetical protein
MPPQQQHTKSQRQRRAPAALARTLARTSGKNLWQEPVARTQKQSNAAATTAHEVTGPQQQHTKSQRQRRAPAALCGLCACHCILARACANERCLRDTRIPQAAAGRPKPAARGLGAHKFCALCGTVRATAFFGKNKVQPMIHRTGLFGCELRIAN